MGEPCCDGSSCAVGLTCRGGTCAGFNSADATLNDVALDSAAEGALADVALDSPHDLDAGDSASPPFLSCAFEGAGTTNCGATRESCCTSLEVTGGTFYRTYDLDEDGGVIVAADGGPTGEADPATVSSFRLDKYEVTVGRFRQFVTAWRNGYTPPEGSGKHTYLNGGRGLVDHVQVQTPCGVDAGSVDAGVAYEPGWVASYDALLTPTDANLTCESWPSWTPMAGANENLPINCVGWEEAYAFCIWDAGFLPSQAEWEYAAAGGNQQRVYPWGSTDPGTDNAYAIYDCHYGPTHPGGFCTGLANLAPVGTATLGAGFWGQLDLAGNVEEYNLDQFDEYFECSGPLFWYDYADPCTDCASFSSSYGSSGSGTMRGGDFIYSSHYLSPPVVPGASGGPTSPAQGFRCARAP